MGGTDCTSVKRSCLLVWSLWLSEMRSRWDHKKPTTVNEQNYAVHRLRGRTGPEPLPSRTSAGEPRLSRQRPGLSGCTARHTGTCCGIHCLRGWAHEGREHRTRHHCTARPCMMARKEPAACPAQCASLGSPDGSGADEGGLARRYWATRSSWG